MLFYMLVGQPPFVTDEQISDAESLLPSLIAKHLRHFPEDNFLKDCLQVLANSLSVQPEQRFTIARLLASNWMFSGGLTSRSEHVVSITHPFNNLNA